MIRPSPEKVGKLGDKIGGGPKIWVPPNHPKLDQFSIESHGLLGYRKPMERGLGWAFQELAREGWWSWALWFTPT